MKFAQKVLTIKYYFFKQTLVSNFFVFQDSLKYNTSGLKKHLEIMRNLKKKIILLGIVSLVTSLVLLYNYNSDTFQIIPESIINRNISKSKCIANNNYLINQHVAQYSSYIVTENSNETANLKIIVHIKLNTKKIKKYG